MGSKVVCIVTISFSGRRTTKNFVHRRVQDIINTYLRGLKSVQCATRASSNQAIYLVLVGPINIAFLYALTVQ